MIRCLREQDFQRFDQPHECGDGQATRLCLERIVPPRRDRPIEFEFPEMKCAADATSAMSSVIQAASSGELTPPEGESVAGLVVGFVKTLETTELEQRIAALEGRAE